MAKTIKEHLREAQEKHLLGTQHNNTALIREAHEIYLSVMNSAIEDPGVMFSAATTFMQLGYNGVAINLLRRCIDLGYNVAEIWNNMGSAYRAEHLITKAEECFKRALELKESPDYLNNIGTLYINEGCPERGVEYLERAIELDPHNTKAHWNYSLLLLEMGDYSRGFEEYDYGLIAGDRPNRFYDAGQSIPFWDGQPLEGKTVVVYGEQGLGDEIMYASALPDLIATGATIIYDCHPRLEGLMRRSFPGIEAFYPTRKKHELDWPLQYKIDYRIPIASLFKHFRRDGNFPRRPYLTPDPRLVTQFKKLLARTGAAPYIGFGWAGGSKRTHAYARSFQLTPLRHLFEMPATFISLQYTEGAEEKLERFYKDTGLRVTHWEEVVKEFDYDYTVALIAALDLCILPNTTAVHVCGAIGQNCITLTPDKRAWRYFPRDGNYMQMYGDWVTQLHESGYWEGTLRNLHHMAGERLQAATAPQRESQANG